MFPNQLVYSVVLRMAEVMPGSFDARRPVTASAGTEQH
jgi:hypothetical protein